MGGVPYSREEEDIIKRWYTEEGLPGAVYQLKLAGYVRTSNSVRYRAHLLQLKSPYCTANRFDDGPIAPYVWKSKQNALYEKAQELISQGASISTACRMAKIQRSVFYRMKKVKENDNRSCVDKLKAEILGEE